MARRWPLIWGRAVDIPFWKSSGRRKTLQDDRFGEKSSRGDRAILRFWWPIRRRLRECWDGPPSATLPTSSRVRGHGCRKARSSKKRSLRQSNALEQVEVAQIRMKRAQDGKKDFTDSCYCSLSVSPPVAPVVNRTLFHVLCRTWKFELRPTGCSLSFCCCVPRHGSVPGRVRRRQRLTASHWNRL